MSAVSEALAQVESTLQQQRTAIRVLDKEVLYLRTITRECPECDGSGMTDPGYHNVGPDKCHACQGYGRVR